MGSGLNFASQDRRVPSFKNKLINGDFTINQRSYVSGTATTIANQYTLDRWRVSILGESVSFAIVDGITTTTAPLGGIEQIIEPLLAGTYSLNINGTATMTVSESVDNVTYSEIVANADGSYTTTGFNYVKINVANGTASMIQFEDGKRATAFEQRPTGFELGLCQRYYESFKGASITLLLKFTNSDKTINYFFKVEKRVAPTVTAIISIPTMTIIDANPTSVKIVGSDTNAQTTTLSALTADAEL